MRIHLVLVLSVWGGVAIGQAQSTPDEALIRAARAGSNKAIAGHDASAVSSLFLADYVSVSSANVESIGHDAGREQYAQLFKARPDVVFVRTADSIAVNSAWGQAAESGHWTGRWTQADGVTNVAGSYFAKWRKADGRWLLLAEVFVQTSCSGSSYCGQKR